MSGLGPGLGIRGAHVGYPFRLTLCFSKEVPFSLHRPHLPREKATMTPKLQ